MEGRRETDDRSVSSSPSKKLSWSAMTILRTPTCGAWEDERILGRVLGSDKRVWGYRSSSPRSTSLRSTSSRSSSLRSSSLRSSSLRSSSLRSSSLEGLHEKPFTEKLFKNVLEDRAPSCGMFSKLARRVVEYSRSSRAEHRFFS